MVSPPDDRPATTTLEVAIKIPAPTTATLPAGATAATAPTTHHRPAAATTAAPYPRAATAGAAATTATGARPGTTAAAATTTSSATAHAEALREGRREHHEGRRDRSDNRDFREHVFLSRKKNMDWWRERSTVALLAARFRLKMHSRRSRATGGEGQAVRRWL